MSVGMISKFYIKFLLFAWSLCSYDLNDCLIIRTVWIICISMVLSTLGLARTDLFLGTFPKSLMLIWSWSLICPWILFLFFRSEAWDVHSTRTTRFHFLMSCLLSLMLNPIAASHRTLRFPYIEASEALDMAICYFTPSMLPFDDSFAASRVVHISNQLGFHYRPQCLRISGFIFFGGLLSCFW